MRSGSLAAAVIIGAVACVLPISGCTVRSAEDETSARMAGTVLGGDRSVDPYDGYFNARISDADPGESGETGGMRGSFGPPRLTAPASWSAAGSPAGEYAVEVECVGATAVDVWVSPGEEPSRQSEPTEILACPAQVVLPLTVTENGYTVVLDSKGEPGAYRVRVTPVG